MPRKENPCYNKLQMWIFRKESPEKRHSTEEQAEQIVQELSAREDVKAVSVTEDRKMLRVESVDGDYKPIMYYAVNVVSRAAGGCELSFDHFDTEELEKALKEKQQA